MKKTIILIALTLGTMQVGLAQKKSKKKSKEERKTEQYQRYKQAMIDTTFFFQTEKIVLPYTPYNGTGGYFAIEPSKVRIQEIDWVNATGDKSRIRTVGVLEGYQTRWNDQTRSLQADFSCVIKGERYLLQISFSIDSGGQIDIQKGNEKMRFEGKIKS
ncbi:hypothetical protein SAMN04490243_2553 [Robiginitalea myxolifaciens]|uniref:DUF4251 domain-containing protein n=1 Tax=Robiginitalea myxolifaciens TaxID=400055 RepID=A0A1I6HC67_9FLAO|nr:hypothetical protein [Robiginitalea myxolifaciens]SFR52106.1 hypothetical protein SAMN04490243_2553 [Robiginitalea myxolifaciens]